MLIFGHRGAPSIKTENTLASFEAALSCNVDGIELDIQLTSDEKIIVYHDSEISDTNNLNHLISNLSFNDIQKLCPNFKIPQLEEVCKIYPKNKIFNIEIKSRTLDNKIIIQRTIQLLTQYQLLENVIISSFNPFPLLQIKKINSNIKLGLLWTGNDSEGWFVTHYSYTQVKPYSFHASINYVDHSIANWAQHKNMKLFLYTINTKKQLEKAQQLNAYAIFSDHPNILSIF